MNYQVKNEEGSVLATTLILLLMLGVLGVSVVYMNTDSQLAAALDQDAIEAFYYAEAGLNYARVNPAVSSQIAFQNGSFELTEVTPVASKLYQVTSVGRKGDAIRVISREVKGFEDFENREEANPISAVLYFRDYGRVGIDGEIDDESGNIPPNQGQIINVGVTETVDYYGETKEVLDFVDTPTNASSSFRINTADAADNSLDLAVGGTISMWVNLAPPQQGGSTVNDNWLGKFAIKGNRNTSAFFPPSGSGSDDYSYSFEYYSTGGFFGGTRNTSTPYFLMLSLTGSNGNEIRLTTPSRIGYSQWYHIAAVWGAEGRAIYVNGSQVANGAGIEEIERNDYDLTLGNQLNSGSVNEFEGQMDEILILNRAIDAEEVQSLFKKRTLYYQLDGLGDEVVEVERSGSTETYSSVGKAHDSTIFLNHGILTDSVVTNAENEGGEAQSAYYFSTPAARVTPGYIWLNTDQKFTLFFKFKVSDLEKEGNLLGYGKVIELSYNYDNDVPQIEFKVKDSLVNPILIVLDSPIDEWQALGIAYDGSHYKLVFNGVHIADIPATVNDAVDFSESKLWFLGSSIYEPSFIGWLDEVSFYQRAVSESDLIDLTE